MSWFAKDYKGRFTSEEFAQIRKREHEEKIEKLKQELGIKNLEFQIQILQNEIIKLKTINKDSNTGNVR